MEPCLLPACVLSLVILPLSLLCLIYFLRKPSTENLPPGTTGWPILGETMAYAFSGSEKFVLNRMEKCSPADVIRTSLYGEKVVIFCGAEANKFLFTNENKLVSSLLPLSTRKIIFSSEYLDMVTREIKQAPSSSSHDILKPEVLKQYIPLMDVVTRQHMDQYWTPNDVVKVVPWSKMYTLELACRLFLNVADSEDITRLADSLTQVSNGLFSAPIDLPGTDYNRAIKGGALARQQMMRIIKKRRKELLLMETGADDLLSKMLLVTDLSEMAICNQMVGFLVASFDTTSSALTSVMNYLASLPHIYEQVMKEQMEIAKAKGPDELLTMEDIKKMKFSWNMARESLRLMPPTQGGFKETLTEFTYAGFTIPKGWKIFWTYHASHKNHKYFPEPEKFDPSRFEGRGPAPYTFVPFGGGLRMCPGRETVRLNILVFMHHVVRRFKLEKSFPDEKIVFKYDKPTPIYGLPIRLQPHEK